MAVDSISFSADPRWSVFPGRHLVSMPVRPDSCDSLRLTKKAPWRATAETVGMNLGLWAFDRYVQQGHYAYISWNTIKENFGHGFEWDNDHLSTNMFAHPYNGSIFYNAGRSNGFNYWQSGLLAIGGSAMWEMFMECEYPSTNDIIATPIGGAAIGEVLYRTSDLLLDDRSSGGQRVGREVAAFLVNPMRGFTRIVTGRAWERRATTGRRFGIPPVSIEMSMGGRLLMMRDNDEGMWGGASAEIDIEYGDRYGDRCTAPYDYFTFLLELGAMRNQPILSRIEIMGRLLSRELIDRRGLSVSAGMYQHFDYFDSDTIKPSYYSPFTPCAIPYKLGVPASIGGGAMARYVTAGGMVLEGYAHANAVLLAGVLNDLYRNYHRNYSWGMGYAFKTGLAWELPGDRLSVTFANQHYNIREFNDFTPGIYDTPYEGWQLEVLADNSRHTSIFNHVEAQARYKLWQRLYLTGTVDFYRRVTRYNKLKFVNGGTHHYYPEVESKQVAFRLMLTYKL